MQNLLKRLLTLALVFELVYLLLINTALNLPLTQSLLNDIRPDLFTLRWQRAWSWYPFRVHARGVLVRGQSASQQWQVQAEAASASISLWRLLTNTVSIHDGHAVRTVASSPAPRWRWTRGNWRCDSWITGRRDRATSRWP